MKKVFRINTIFFAAIILFLAAGCKKEESAFKTVQEPILTTTSVTDVTATTAISGGNITYDECTAAITDRGVDCWRPTNRGRGLVFRRISVGTGTGNFTINLTGLHPGTYYYLRSYATNNAGMAYGNQISFKTSGK